MSDPKQAAVTITGRRRDWRWLWLRHKPVEVVIFRGYIKTWPTP